MTCGGMIGDDVVDLEDPESRPEARHPRFDERVFSTRERERIAASPWPERERWILWAAKEAAYKLLRSGDPGVLFSPSRFEVERDGERSGFVRWQGRRLALDLRIDSHRVHAVARNVEPIRLVARCARTWGGDASGRVRALAIETLGPLLGASPRELRIERRPGEPPELWLRGRPSGVPLSLSHHGRFVAFACALAPGAGWAA